MSAARRIQRLWRRRRVTLPAVLVLALGIGLSTAMWSVIDGVLWRGLPFEAPDSLVMVATHGAHDRPVPVEDFLALRETRALRDVAGLRTFNTIVSREDGGSKGLTASYVTANLFSMLGVAPAIGRGLEPSDEEPGAPSVALLSHAVWQSHFGADSEILGQTVIVNREPMTVVGVMPEGFAFPIRQQAWAALHWQGRPWSSQPLFAVARLREDLDAEGAERELESLAVGLDAERPLSGGGEVTPREIRVTPYVEAILPPRIQSSLRVLLAGALAFLLVGCANAGHLRVADALARDHELALRRALGAGRFTLLRELLAESATAVAAGLLGGLAVAAVLVGLAETLLLQGSLLVRQFWIDVRLDGRALLFALGATGVAFGVGGLAPACWTLWRERFRIEVRSDESPGRQRLVRVFVLLQVAASFALLLGAGLMVRTANGLLGVEPGFEPERLAATQVGTYQSDRRGEEELRDLWTEVLGALEASSEIESVTLGGSVPWRAGSTRVMHLGISARDGAGSVDLRPRASVVDVLPGFEEVLGLPLLSGRTLDWRDQERMAAEGDSAAVSALVSRTLAERHWSGSPLGERFEIEPSFARGEPTFVEVVGVVADLGIGRRDVEFSEDHVYLPRPWGAGGGFLITRGSVRADVLPVIDREITRVDPRVATFVLESYEQARAETSWVERRLSQLFSLYGVAALVLGTVGLYGMAALWVTRRRRELGVRLALGAAPRDLRRAVVKEAGRTLLGGLALGGLGSVLVVLALRGFLYGVEPWDPAVLALTALLMTLSWLAATLGPATAAGRTDPLESLRGE